jgi:hypothetical protein
MLGADINTDLSCFLIVGVFVFIAVGIYRNRNYSGSERFKVDNTVVSWDRTRGAYLVEAKNTHYIEGANTHVMGNLPANIHYYGKSQNGLNLYVVDPYQQFDTAGGRNDVQHTDFCWEPAPRGSQILPRGETKTPGFLHDVVDGYQHNYLHNKKDPIPVSKGNQDPAANKANREGMTPANKFWKSL